MVFPSRPERDLRNLPWFSFPGVCCFLFPSFRLSDEVLFSQSRELDVFPSSEAFREPQKDSHSVAPPWCANQVFPSSPWTRYVLSCPLRWTTRQFFPFLLLRCCCFLLPFLAREKKRHGRICFWKSGPAFRRSKGSLAFSGGMGSLTN